MERQKGRLRANLDATQKDLDSIVKQLTRMMKDAGLSAASALAENDSKKFKKAHEVAKKQQQQLEDTLDKISRCVSFPLNLLFSKTL